MADDNVITDSEPNSENETVMEERYDVNYKCLRCGTINSNSDLTVLPEIKCICGFRVFLKVRSPIVKSVKAI